MPKDRSISFLVAFEQMAKMLRTEVKKETSIKVLNPNSLPSSFRNSIEQIAKLLRSQTHVVKPLKKRSWKKSSIKK